MNIERVGSVEESFSKARKTNDRRWSRGASTRDLPIRQSPDLFPGRRAAATWCVPVPGILATHRPGPIMDKSGRHFVVLLSDISSQMTKSNHEPKQQVLPMS
jgi:hypothetical protein